MPAENAESLFETPADVHDREWPLPDFVGALASGKGDLAARSSEILRAELGRETE